MSDTAAAMAYKLQTAHRALAVATKAVEDVMAGLAEIATREHMTAACYAGHHALCPKHCRCTDCEHECECTCHLVISGLRAY